MPYKVQFALRRSTLLHAILLPLVLLLTACGTTSPSMQSTTNIDSGEQSALRTLIAQQDRLYHVAAPLLVNNADLCKGNARNLLGFTAKNKYSFSADMADAAQSLFGFDERLQVTGILAGSGAAKAGVRRGDILVSAEGKPIPSGQNAERQAASTLIPLVNGRSSIKMIVQRNGVNIPLDIPLTRACAYSIELGNADNVNAYADGRRVLITRGMMNFVRSDEELAYVLAKEMSHNSLAHASKQKMSGTLGEIIDNLSLPHPDMSTMAGTSGVKATPQELDAAADTLSLYMLARAGYSIDNAASFWERLATQYPATVLNGYTAIHPSTSYRMSVMQQIVPTVKSKQASRQPLMP